MCRRNRERCRENSFKSVQFIYDQSVPTALYDRVCIKAAGRESAKANVAFSYLPKDGDGTAILLMIRINLC